LVFHSLVASSRINEILMITIKSVLLSLGLATLAWPVAAATSIDLAKLPPPAKKEGVTYASDIRPLFEASCVRCHGSNRPKNGLRLDTLEGVLKGSKDGAVVVAGQSDKSKLVLAVSQLDNESAMPPKPRARRGGTGAMASQPNASGEGKPPGVNERGTNQPQPRGPMGPPPKPLTAEEVGLVRAWVDQGVK
jgi:mono/diheme cytochrome c family protein